MMNGHNRNPLFLPNGKLAQPARLPDRIAQLERLVDSLVNYNMATLLLLEQRGIITEEQHRNASGAIAKARKEGKPIADFKRHLQGLEDAGGKS